MYIPKHFEITEVQCKYKLWQNRPKEDQKRVTKQLQEKGSGELGLAINAQEN